MGPGSKGEKRTTPQREAARCWRMRTHLHAPDEVFVLLRHRPRSISPACGVVYAGVTLELLKEDGASNNQITRPEGVPPIHVSSQLSIAETKGTANDTSSIYVWAPREVVLVRRMDAVVELDRSRLFDRDMSEVRARLRADLIVPNPVAVVRINGVKG
jgi:hypothetical protein